MNKHIVYNAASSPSYEVGLTDIVSMAVRALLANKIRSALTVLGVIIGVAAIIIVMSIGNAAQGLILKEVESFGAQNVFINPGRTDGNPMSAMSSVLSNSLTQRDVDSLSRAENVPDAALVNPSVMGSLSADYQNKSVVGSIIGSGEHVFEIYNMTVSAGRLFTRSDVEGKARVAVLGENVAHDLFGPSNPLGEKIKLKNEKFTVIGIFSSKNASMFGIDDMIAVPYSSAQTFLLGGIKHFHEVVVQARNVEAVPNMVKDITRTLRDNHNIADPSKDDFTIQTQADIMKSVDSVLGTLTAFLSFVAAISLLVGGVGVMNIMFVSVTERTREIGLRKALGATHRAILFQFLCEAIFLTAGGGIVGILAGLGTTALAIVIANRITSLSFPFIVSWTGMLLGIVVAVCVGLVFGIFPARQAAKKSPIEALRYE